MIRVLCIYDVADSHETIARIIESQSDMKLLASVHSQAWPQQRIQELSPHVVVFDVLKDGVRRVGLVYMVASTFPASRALVVIDPLDSVPLDELLKAGACGVIQASGLDSRLADAIRVVAAGGVVLWGDPPPLGPLAGPGTIGGTGSNQ